MLLRINRRKGEENLQRCGNRLRRGKQMREASALPLVMNRLRQLSHRAFSKKRHRLGDTKTIGWLGRSMIKQFKGTSQLAQLADGLPVRSRIGLTLVAGGRVGPAG